nr:hypothetical protein Itr_chr15CG16000 [Ipomoea trifida]
MIISKSNHSLSAAAVVFKPRHRRRRPRVVMLSGCGGGGNLSRRKSLPAKPKLYIPAVIVVEIRPALLPRPFFRKLSLPVTVTVTVAFLILL